MKYLENLMAHPTWFTVFTLDKPKDFHLYQLKHPVLRNIEKIQQFYRKSLAEAICIASKGYQYPSVPSALIYQPNPYFRFNESNYDQLLYREFIRKKIQPSEVYTSPNNKLSWLSGYRLPESSCRNLYTANQWIPQKNNVTEEVYETQMNDNLKVTEINRNDLPENFLQFVDNPSGIISNIKDIFGKTNNSQDLEYLPAHSASEYVDRSKETI